jgi:hypothetical protein
MRSRSTVLPRSPRIFGTARVASTTGKIVEALATEIEIADCLPE